MNFYVSCPQNPHSKGLRIAAAVVWRASSIKCYWKHDIRFKQPLPRLANFGLLDREYILTRPTNRASLTATDYAPVLFGSHQK